MAGRGAHDVEQQRVRLPGRRAEAAALASLNGLRAEKAALMQSLDGEKAAVRNDLSALEARSAEDRAKQEAGKVLATASAYTEPVIKNSTTLYRARFAGFKSKEAARAACDYLAKRDFACLALSNSSDANSDKRGSESSRFKIVA